MEIKKLTICEKNKGYEYQGPRFKKLGPYSGEEFREEHLAPWLAKLGEQEESVIDFNGTKVYSPSFLEESFGGVIRESETVEKAEINRKKLQFAKFENMDPVWNEKLAGYIKNARYKTKNGS
ncbi:MAG: STAS-like domain-containing protein [Treponema sp.]|jgi:hypothetical protein|nr:STAS-like domain-containing protein [Treponema sp.]